MKRITEAGLNKEIYLYRHMLPGQVKFHEVDSFGVVHNIQYMYFLEWARTEYLRSIGMDVNHRTFTTELPLMVAHSEIDYLNSAMFNDEYEVLGRVSAVYNSSIKFENIIRLKDDKIIAKASAVMVYLSTETYQPDRVPDEMRERILMFEGENVKFIEK